MYTHPTSVESISEILELIHMNSNEIMEMLSNDHTVEHLEDYVKFLNRSDNEVQGS